MSMPVAVYSIGFDQFMPVASIYRPLRLYLRRGSIVPDPQFPDEVVILDFVMRTSEGGRKFALAAGTGLAAYARRRH